MPRHRPLVGVISDRRTLGHHAFQIQGEKYLRAVADVAGAFPVGLPSLGLDFDVVEILAELDGLLLTGSPSNVEPRHYRGAPSRPGTRHDAERDLAALALIQPAIRAGLPLLAICRGFQELNVAFGGTLHQALDEVPGFARHREDKDAPVEEQYGPAHEVQFTPGGLLARVTGREAAVVNSVHSQGISELGEGLTVEATAADGLVEAVTVGDAPGFVLGVQWHPEWQAAGNDVSAAIFRAFGDACRSQQS